MYGGLQCQNKYNRKLSEENCTFYMFEINNLRTDIVDKCQYMVKCRKY